MANGTVKWFNNKKGYGFIVPESQETNKDVFVHISAVQEAGLKRLEEGQQVSYDLYDDRGREAANNIQIIK